MNEYADAVGSTPHFLTGTSRLLGNAFMQAAMNGQGDQALRAVLDRFDRAGGDEKSDLTEWLALAGQLTPYARKGTVDRARDTLFRVVGKLHQAETAANALRGDAVSATMRSAFAGIEAMARAKLLEQKDRLKLAALKRAPGADRAIEAALAVASADDKGAMLRELVATAKNETIDTIRLSALRAAGRYLPRETLLGLETAIIRSVQEQAERPEEERDYSALGLLQTAEQFGAQPEVRLAARQLMARAVQHLPKGYRDAAGAASRTVDVLVNHEGDTMALLQRLLTELGPLALDLGLTLPGILSPGPICSTISSAVGLCVAIRRGDRVGAALAAIGLVPILGKLAHGARLGRQVQAVIQLATRGQQLILRLAHLRDRIQRAANIAGIAVQGLQALRKGQSPLNEDTLSLLLEVGAASRGLARPLTALQLFAPGSRQPEELVNFSSVAGVSDVLGTSKAGCRTTAAGQIFSSLASAFEQSGAWMKDRLQNRPILSRLFPRFAPRMGPTIRGAMPDEDTDAEYTGALIMEVGGQLQLDEAQRRELTTAIEALPTPPQTLRDVLEVALPIKLARAN